MGGKMMNSNAKKILVLALAASIIVVSIPQTCATSVLKTKEITVVDAERSNEMLPKQSNNETEYYAVIAACTNYDRLTMNIPNGPFPIPERKLIKLYDALIESKNWNESNIILLLNRNATKENITNALQEMSHRVGPNDIFLFSWQGHGGDEEDIDGDEKINNQRDKYDEAIYPYDYKNYITDDELGDNFSKINAKGMCLIFESCLSGGLVNRSRLVDRIGMSEINYINSFNEDFRRDIDSKIGTLDVDGGNRVVILCTLPNTIGRVTLLTGFPMTRALAFALKGFARDKDKDGYISAEEAFKIARPLTLAQSSMYYGGLWMFYCLMNTLTGTPDPVSKATTSIIKTEIRIILMCLLLTGYICLNWPNMIDNYEGALPLIEI